MAFCFHCGEKLEEGNNFCTGCGTAVNKTSGGAEVSGHINIIVSE